MHGSALIRHCRLLPILLLCFLCTRPVFAAALGELRGVVHDPQHRPIGGSIIELAAENSSFKLHVETASDGTFVLAGVPVGKYVVTASHEGFETLHQPVTVLSGTSSILHFELPVGAVSQTVTVKAPLQDMNAETATPTAIVDRKQIADTPGADKTNSLAMITDYVPGAYMTHDMLHIRGGHQVSWLIDGVEIPNTNISSNLGPQVDPKDIDYLEVQRGSYSAALGDRTYGAFNVVPRTGFERNREGELVLSAGNFFQTNDQISLGDHTEKFAWYASLNGNRSDYGLAPPIEKVFHDASNGFGGFGSIIYNRTPKDQFRVVAQARQDYFQIPYDPDPGDFENQQYDSSGLRDAQRETDAVAAFSYIHTFGSSTVLQIAPFYHFNRADYEPGAGDLPVGTTSRRGSNYGGMQASITAALGQNTFQGGLYSFGQHDANTFGAKFNDQSSNNFSISNSVSGGLIEEYVSANLKPVWWLTIMAGLRQSHFDGSVPEDETSPRVGASIRIPELHWVFRGFYGKFYQPPPLLTASGPLIQYATSNATSFAPLHGERDEEHQFGVAIPFRGWMLDIDTFETRAKNFLDHASIGESSLYYPVTVDGARIRAWELTLASPQILHIGQAHLAYSNQIAEQRGSLTGGLICEPVTSPQCDAGFDYVPVDHDQRNTLNVGFNATLPRGMTASTNVYYGSGFVNGNPGPATPYPNAYLPQHTTFDLAVGKRFGERLSASVTATNVANRRVLLDNSETFGGFHFNDPRQIYAEVRYHFHF